MKLVYKGKRKEKRVEVILGRVYYFENGVETYVDDGTGKYLLTVSKDFEEVKDFGENKDKRGTKKSKTKYKRRDSRDNQRVRPSEQGV